MFQREHEFFFRMDKNRNEINTCSGEEMGQVLNLPDANTDWIPGKWYGTLRWPVSDPREQ